LAYCREDTTKDDNNESHKDNDEENDHENTKAAMTMAPAFTTISLPAEKRHWFTYFWHAGMLCPMLKIFDMIPRQISLMMTWQKNGISEKAAILEEKGRCDEQYVLSQIMWIVDR